MQVRVSDEDYADYPNSYRKTGNSQSAECCNRLLESQRKLVELAKQLLEAKAK
jgi:hypothetical protein